MKDQIKVSIDKPCSEKFSEFEPTQRGGFCQSCQKEVIDFTAMSDKEIMQYFQSAPTRTCGRFNTSQFKTYVEDPLPKQNSFFNLLGTSLMSLSLLSLLPSNLQAQQRKKPEMVVVNQHLVEEDTTTNKTTSKTTYTLSGVVKAEGEPLPGTTVYIKGTTRGTLTDIDGNFRLEVEEGDIIVFNFVGFDSIERATTIKDVNTPISITLTSYKCLSGEVSIEKTYSSKKSLWQKIKSLFR